MPTPPAQPYIWIQSGATVGSITEDGTFNWYNSGTGDCSVTDVSGWCTQSSYSVSPGSQSATVKSVNGNYSFRSACCQNNMPVVIVHPLHPVAVKKTA